MRNIFRQKKTNWVILSSCILIFISGSRLTAQTITPGDTAFIQDLVKFYQSRSGNVIKNNPYTLRANDSAHFYVFVANKERIENSLKNVGHFLYCKHSKQKARSYDSIYSNVNDCYTFSTSANAGTQLTSELLSYRPETQAFIVFHELTHALLSAVKSKVTYTVSESICDLVGNYLTREYAVAKKTLNLRTVDAQITMNEHIYNVINSTILRINTNAKQKDAANLFLSKDLTRTLAKGDAYQKQRFDDKINNAYLLKNSFISENYSFYKTKFVYNRTLPEDLRDLTK